MHPPAWLMRPDWNYLQRTRGTWWSHADLNRNRLPAGQASCRWTMTPETMAAGRGCRRSGFGQSREDPLPARARIGGLPDLRQCWSERGAFLQQPKSAWMPLALPTWPVHAMVDAPVARPMGRRRMLRPMRRYGQGRNRTDTFRVQTGCSAIELPAHDPPRERGGDEICYDMVGLVASNPQPGAKKSTCSAERLATHVLSKTSGKRRTPAGEAGVRECAGRTWS